MPRVPLARRGQDWEPLSGWLPETPYYASVLRDAMCADDAVPVGVGFGTRAGEVHASAEEGDSWSLAAAHLPDVRRVRAAEV